MLSDNTITHLPDAYEAILQDSRDAGFGMPSDTQTGALLRLLASSKPHGRFLELGTGTGLGTTWLLDGMDNSTTLISVESNGDFQKIARSHLSGDKRLEFVEGDGLSYITNRPDEEFDLIYADTWPGKYTRFEHSLRLLKQGGILVLDDMLPQPNWPSDHPPKVEALLASIESLPPVRYSVLRMCWYTGHILITKK